MLADLTARAIACLLLYMLAVAALPQPKDDEADLKAHFERARPLFFGVYGLYIALVGFVYPMLAGRISAPEPERLVMAAVLTACVFVRRRWFLGLVLVGLLARGVYFWFAQSIAG
jgi:hypothetical protein